MLWFWERAESSFVWWEMVYVGDGGFGLANLFASRVEGAKLWVAICWLGSPWCGRLMFTS